MTKKAQISKISIFGALETTSTPKKAKFRKFRIFGHQTVYPSPKIRNFENFNGQDTTT